MKKNSAFTLRSGNKPSIAKLTGVSPVKQKINIPPSVKVPPQPKQHTLRGITGFEADFPGTVRHLRNIRKVGKQGLQQYVKTFSPKENIKRVKKLGKRIKDYFTLK
tara:strand:- start:482 stop:799 length:318 start_codon:yes stop_codon:yes gene_type:complete